MVLKLDGKSIADPLYGSVQLTKLESQIVSSAAFQRLHNVRQLGLGHLVFPSAAYSRFSHSVGACANADRILSAIESNSERRFSDDERQGVRLAALLHDLGHFPFSHTTEHAMKRYVREGIYQKVDANPKQHELKMDLPCAIQAPIFIDHEDTGKLVFNGDVEIGRAVSQSGITQELVNEVFLDPALASIISSDLDCDRLDYLRRTSLHSGAPYGAVDVDFIISKATVDDEGRFCFGHKALRATDHLLMSRFYDFMQIPYQKTVAALEWSLEEAVIHLQRNGKIDFTRVGIEDLLTNDTWKFVDDGSLTEVLRAEHTRLFNISDHAVVKDHLRSVLFRRPAKIVYDWDCLLDSISGEPEAKQQLLELKIDRICETMSLDRERFNVWRAPFKLAKAGPLLQRAPSEGASHSEEEEQQLILIKEKGVGRSRPLINLPNAVSHHLAKLQYKTLRVYYLAPEGLDPGDLTRIASYLQDG